MLQTLSEFNILPSHPTAKMTTITNPHLQPTLISCDDGLEEGYQNVGMQSQGQQNQNVAQVSGNYNNWQDQQQQPPPHIGQGSEEWTSHAFFTFFMNSKGF